MRRESPKMGCGHRPVGGLFALPRVPNEARVRLTLKRRFFFLAEMWAHVVLWLPRRGPAGGSEAAPGLGAAGGAPPPAGGGVP